MKIETIGLSWNYNHSQNQTDQNYMQTKNNLSIEVTNLAPK